MYFVGRVRKVIILLRFIGMQSIENQCVLQYRFHNQSVCFGLVSFKKCVLLNYCVLVSSVGMNICVWFVSVHCFKVKLI